MDQDLSLGITSDGWDDTLEPLAACAAEARAGVVLVEHTEVDAAEIVGLQLALAACPVRRRCVAETRRPTPTVR
jgi:hypothetical protein